MPQLCLGRDKRPAQGRAPAAACCVGYFRPMREKKNIYAKAHIYIIYLT